MTTIKPRAADAVARRPGADEATSANPSAESTAEPAARAPVTAGASAGAGALAARAGQHMLLARPDIVVKRLLTASYVGVWAWEKYARKVAGVPAVSAQKMMYELAKSAINETKLGGLTVQAMHQSSQVALNLAKAGQVVVKPPAAPMTIAGTPLGKIIPYLNALAVPLAAWQVVLVENDPHASTVEKNLARASLTLTTLAAGAGFTSNPVGWAVSAGAGALASGSDLALMAVRNQGTLAVAYESVKSAAREMLQSLRPALSRVHP